MTIRASYGEFVTHSVVLVVALVLGVGACNSARKNLPSLPAVPKFFAGGETPGEAKNNGLVYRQEQGQAISPVVISDDPVPTEAQPGAATGQAGGRVTLNGDANGLTRESLNRSIQAAMGSLAACFTSLTQDPMVAVSFEADPSGRPSLVRVNGAPPDAERCIRNVVQGIRFPSFEGKGVQIDLPLSFHRTAVAPQPGNPSGEQQPPAAPPLFMEP
jgi:hypothetical protein